MLLQMRSALGDLYKSGAQKARVVSEDWAEANLYCAACPSDSLRRLPHNNRSIDFECPDCGSGFQLKSSSRKFGGCILDGDCETMRHTILSGRTPSLLTLHYGLANWSVQNLSLIPSFAFTLSCIQRRNPLSPTARRAPYTGCNILLRNIPADARIPMVADGIAELPDKVRKQFDTLRPISRLNAAQRGWTLDVLRAVRSLNKQSFTLGDVLSHASELTKLHPENRHVEAKIRQQLQRLRNLGILEFLDNRGTYKLRTVPADSPSRLQR